MANNELRKRGAPNGSTAHKDAAVHGAPTERGHPSGIEKAGIAREILRILLSTTWFLGCCVVLSITQFLGAPLYFYDKNWFYAYMALTKQCFGIVVITITQWFSPTTIRVSGDVSVQAQLKQTEDGRLVTAFPERMVLISNHQIYTDWLYLWWISYTSRMHGHLYIVLKESLKYIPFMGWGMMFYGFIFMSRKWEADKPRLKHRIDKLKTKHQGPLTGSPSYLDPMWLLLFPEGTNLSANTRKSSVRWAEKQGIPDMKHVLLPRSTGLLFCLQEVKGTVDYVYDCTMAYEGTVKGDYASQHFTIRSTFFQGRPPKSVNMHWRRFAISSIPLDDPKAFEKWLSDRWNEKDQLLQHFLDTGRFPPSEGLINSHGKQVSAGYIETEVRLEKWWEIGQIFVTLAAFGFIVDIVVKLCSILLWPFKGWS